MKRFKNKRKVISLTLVSIAYVLIVTPLIISNLQKQQSLHGKVEGAQTSRVAEFTTNATTYTSESECIPDGNAGLGVLYTNADTKPVTITATDQTSGHSLTLGQILPKETKIGTILTKKPTISSGDILFTVTTDTNQILQKVSSYMGISCN
jgi:hypothetical protein